MSIYATLWEIKVRRNHPFDEEWIEVFAQAVPAHIGHPSGYPDGDPYADFLPPVVEYDPTDGERDWVERAVVIVAEDRREKVGQRYTSPLMTLTGAEYRALSLSALMRRIEKALPWDDTIVGYKIGPDGGKTIIRRAKKTG